MTIHPGHFRPKPKAQRRVRVHRFALDPLRSARLRALLAEKVEKGAERRRLTRSAEVAEAGSGNAKPPLFEHRDERS